MIPRFSNYMCLCTVWQRVPRGQRFCRPQPSQQGRQAPLSRPCGGSLPSTMTDKSTVCGMSTMLRTWTSLPSGQTSMGTMPAINKEVIVRCVRNGVNRNSTNVLSHLGQRLRAPCWAPRKNLCAELVGQSRVVERTENGEDFIFYICAEHLGYVKCVVYQQAN